MSLNEQTKENLTGDNYKMYTEACCVFNCADMGRDRKTTEIKGEKLPENLPQECFYRLTKKRELGSCSMKINKTNPSLF